MVQMCIYRELIQVLDETNKTRGKKYGNQMHVIPLEWRHCVFCVDNINLNITKIKKKWYLQCRAVRFHTVNLVGLSVLKSNLEEEKKKKKRPTPTHRRKPILHLLSGASLDRHLECGDLKTVW